MKFALLSCSISTVSLSQNFCTPRYYSRIFLIVGCLFAGFLCMGTKDLPDEKHGEAEKNEDRVPEKPSVVNKGRE